MAARWLRYSGCALLFTGITLDLFLPRSLAFVFIAASFPALPSRLNDAEVRRGLARALILIGALFLAFSGYREVERGLEPEAAVALLLLWLGMTLVLLSDLFGTAKSSAQGSP